MTLLDDDLRRQLPPIRKFHNPADDEQRMIFAKVFAPKSGVAFYVAEGEPRNLDYMFWGLLITPQFKFPLRFQITVSRLQTKDWVGQEPCRRDEKFRAARWEAVERTIPNLRRPLSQPLVSSSKVR